MTSALDVTASAALAFRQVSAGDIHTCGVTTDDRAYCWGFNDFGQLGDGTTTERLRPVPVAGGHRFRQVTATVLSAHGRSRAQLKHEAADSRLSVASHQPSPVTRAEEPSRQAAPARLP